MTFRFWSRWAPALGIGAVALWIISFAIGGSTPDTSDSDAEITSYYASHSHQVKQIVSFFVFFVGVLLFLAFLSGLRARLAAAEGGITLLAPLALVAGVISAIFWIIGVAMFTAPAFVANDVKPSIVDANTVRILSNLGYELWVAAVITGAVLLWVAAAFALRRAVFAPWFGWLSIVAGVILLLAIFFVPVFVYWGWIALASVLLSLRPRSEPTPAPLTTRP